MPRYTQEGSPLRVYTTLEPDTLLLNRFTGTESVSRPFHYQIELLSEKSDIDAKDLLRGPVQLIIEFADGEPRWIHGLISRFIQLEQDEHLTAYRAEVVPWLWFLSLSSDCRIYQEMTVLEIVEAVFKDHGHADFEFRTTRSYPKREYCVQYRESHLDFISRLLEEEGLFYYFEHTAEQHMLVISDSNGRSTKCEGAELVHMARQQSHEEDVVLGLWSEHSVHTGRVALADYDFLQPSLDLETMTDSNGSFEAYDYPGGYASRDEGERYTRLQMEAIEATHHLLRGTGNCRGFRSGGRFELEDHYRDDLNQEYLLLEVRHQGTAGDYRSAARGSADYNNQFECIPFSIPFRPLRRTRKPVVRGSQTALVVGPAGEEVYVDSHSRVKVQFYWDRYGQRDENSSCWVRVASPWAGKSWGAISIPRIGNEVLVHFLEGDPDRPIIVGSVYNAEQTPPFALPAAGIQMGMKTRSSKGGGGYNEITMTDTKGSEKVNIHAQKDMSTTVLNNDAQTVQNDRTITVNGKHTETIKKDTEIKVTEGNYKHEVLTGGSTVAVKNGRNTTIEGNEVLRVTTASRSVTVAENNELTAKQASITTEVITLLQTGNAEIALEPGKIELKVSNSKITIDASSIKLEAGGSMIELKAAGVKVEGSTVTSHAKGGPHEIKGDPVKLNP